jgi:hypothetical protein
LSEVRSFGDWASWSPEVGVGRPGVGSAHRVEMGMSTFEVVLCGTRASESVRTCGEELTVFVAWVDVWTVCMSKSVARERLQYICHFGTRLRLLRWPGPR